MPTTLLWAPLPERPPRLVKSPQPSQDPSQGHYHLPQLLTVSCDQFLPEGLGLFPSGTAKVLQGGLGQGQPGWRKVGSREVSWRREALTEGAKLVSNVLRLPLSKTEA